MKIKDLHKLIPNAVRITAKESYEVLFIDEFLTDTRQLGECRYTPSKQILLKNGQSSTEMFKSFLHESLHAASFEYKDLNLTERQVQILEEAIFKMLKLNKVFDRINL